MACDSRFIVSSTSRCGQNPANLFSLLSPLPPTFPCFFIKKPHLPHSFLCDNSRIVSRRDKKSIDRAGTKIASQDPTKTPSRKKKDLSVLRENGRLWDGGELSRLLGPPCLPIRPGRHRVRAVRDGPPSRVQGGQIPGWQMGRWSFSWWLSVSRSGLLVTNLRITL